PSTRWCTRTSSMRPWKYDPPYERPTMNEPVAAHSPDGASTSVTVPGMGSPLLGPPLTHRRILPAGLSYTAARWVHVFSSGVSGEHAQARSPTGSSVPLTRRHHRGSSGV